MSTPAGTHSHGHDPPPNGSEREGAEAELLAATRAVLDDWASRDSGALDRFLSHFDPHVIALGTGADEVAFGRDVLADLMRREHRESPSGFTYTLSGTQARALNATAGFVHSDLSIHVPPESAGGSEGLTLGVRLTCVFQGSGSGWRVVHWMAARPDPEQAEGETWPLDALRARNQKLERLVAERTADLRAAQAQLVHQEKMASLGALTAGIAHEIKNPLNFVTNFAALAVELADELSGAGDDERAEIVGDLRANAARIVEHGARADAIVTGMMQHAQGGTGEREAVDLNGLVREYAEHARHALLARDPDTEVTLDLRLGNEVGTVDLIPQEIGRVLVALIDNAFDAVLDPSREGTEAGAVTVTTSREDGRAVVRVEDNGVGIDDAALGRVFEPFYTTKPTGQGHTGLGLSLAHDAVVQGHGGTLTAESYAGTAAAFTLSLPTIPTST